MVVSTSNFVKVFIVRGETRDTLSRSVGQADQSRGMVDNQHIQCKTQQKTSSNRQNIAPCKEIGVKESNSNVKIFTKN